MSITVILSTYNRSRDLARALDSIAASTLPNSVEWEILVVDNNSTDQTRAVVEGFCRKYPSRFRYLFHSHPGKSYALNAAIREASGDILAFMDDDATVEPAWLWNLTSALHDPEWAGAGGRIVLQWPSSIPSWLSIDSPSARHCFPGFDQGREAKELNGPPFGVNMAFRKTMFEKYGGFRTDLGPSPNPDIPPHSEDTEFGRRLIANGERLRYEPLAVVYHPVQENRIDKDYFLKWWFHIGRAEIREFGIPGDSRWRAGGVPLSLLCRLAAWTLRWMVALEPSRRFSNKVIVWSKAGQIFECRRQLIGAKMKT